MREYYTSVSMENRHFILKGTHIGLAEMLVADQPQFRQWLSDNEALRALVDSPSIPTEADQQAWFRRSQENDRKMFSVLTLPEEPLIGNAGLVDIDPAAGTAQLRITLGESSSHGKGYGTEATQLLLRYAFEVMGLQSVWLRVLKDNARAIRVYEKAGFIPSMGTDDPRMLRMTIDRSTFHSQNPA